NQAAPPPGFSGGCSLDATFPPDGRGLAPINPSVSQDGSIIVFERPNGFGIWKMNADASGAQEVIPSVRGNGHPAISPDGTKIAFIQLTGDYNQLFTVNIDGSGPTQMTFLPQDHVNSVAWSPESTQLVFEDTSCGFFYSLKTINADGTGERF